MILVCDDDVTIWRQAKHVRVHCVLNENRTVVYVMNQIRIDIGRQIEQIAERM
jgi:hypothetical protein